MNFIIFCIYIPLVHSELHTFMTTYTKINGQTIAGIPEISSVTLLDGRQIDYYDSEIKILIPRQDWMKEFNSTETWKEYTEVRQRVQQTNEINITVLMEQFNHSHGVHTYQRMYGCDWDNETGHSNWFDQHGYDGQDFISLDVENSRYITAVPQGFKTVDKLNNDSAQLNYLRQYYRDECVGWVIYFLISKKVDLETRAPEVSLLQKDPSSPVLCHATGFYPSAVTITWLRNGEANNEDVSLGKTLPNDDGTFQKTSTLTIQPDNWKKNQYICVVKHKGKTIQKILTDGEIKSNRRPKKTNYTIYMRVMYVFIVILIVFVVLCTGAKVLDWKKTKEFHPLSQPDDGMYINKESHTLTTAYTEMNRQVAGIPEISSVTLLDGRQIDFYDGEIKKLIPRQDWMKEFASGGRFKEYTEFREQLQRTNEISIRFLMQQFNQTHGFYPSAVTITWLKNGQYNDEDEDPGELLPNEDGTFQKAVSLIVTPDNWKRHQYVCLVKHEGKTIQKILTKNKIKSNDAFVDSAITWLRNAEKRDEDVDLGKLSNEDGTFQKTVNLHALPDERKKIQYVPVVRNQFLDESKIKSKDEPAKVHFITPLASVAGVMLFLFICSFVRMMLS
ncbi:hypothetical protein Q8A67_005589 [Cirrhinus molitorella]|uniref:Ig-like domain-containing protein n=1 Tax=Cirrhinus molitorella TaxID=172907 RepID=A0AA88Q7B1_9TELE|nr:hypothetical protein Q8A67_005589 [Cirrhinus molitorella]